LVETRKGSLLAAWFGGTKEGANDVSIYLSRRNEHGWSVPVQVATGLDSKGKQIPCWNPVLFQPSHGPLMLFYKVGRQIVKWTGWERNSTNAAADIGAIQPSLLVAPDGTIIAVGRTLQRRIFYQESNDHGVHWEDMRLLDVKNPNSGIDAVTLKSGLFVLVYNDSDSKRTPLDVATSTDGVSWEKVAVLENTPGEFSYPAVIQTADGKNRQKIKHVVLDPSSLVATDHSGE
jgi:predicted neuraminidase